MLHFISSYFTISLITSDLEVTICDFKFENLGSDPKSASLYALKPELIERQVSRSGLFFPLSEPFRASLEKTAQRTVDALGEGLLGCPFFCFVFFGQAKKMKVR